MIDQNFTTIAQRYRETSSIQKSAAEILLSILDIKQGERVFDVGCGTGNLTKKILGITGTQPAGIDPSEGMVSEARKSFGELIPFQKMSAEEMTFDREFDVIFCNSTFQWIKNTDAAIRNFHRALAKGGRIGIQAPAKQVYCPNFIEAVDEVARDRRTKRFFQYFKSPWFFLDTADDYSECFARNDFHVSFSEIQKVESLHNPGRCVQDFCLGCNSGLFKQGKLSERLR